MKRLVNTQLFCLLKEIDGTSNPDEQEIRSVYDEFVYKVTSICSLAKGDVPPYFTLHYTRLELERFQTLLDNKREGKKCINS